MQLQLAIVLSCRPDGCRVQPLDGGGAIDAAYAAPVLGRVKIRPRQLVAVDMSASPAEVVYRWFVGEVVRVEGERVAVVRRTASGEPLGAAELPTGGLDLRPGDEMFFTKEPSRLYEAVDGRPAHPERLVAEAFPCIEEYYAGMTR